ncbi:prolyl 4-hydroxylase subunit alpha-1 [Anastrepha ludens]|uniref:prolyl 4-hydroxylase subunit alpha-1 n=1 Tax=Anastrepha ludens TaxID=28586 RepID=UPI0023AEA9AC|nr:prolyl 4-hydroxylase subunit alpha-1 [Anastrepha ludens]
MEFYSSVHQMTKLVQFEAVFLRHMQKYIKANENKLEFLKARLEELEADRDEALREGADYFESPLNMYMLTKRLTMDWERVENLMQYESGKKSLNAIERYKDAIPYPGTSELDGAIDGLVRIQDVYRLNTADMAQGILDGVKYDVNLDARLCFDIAKYAAKENKTRLAHAWATEALRLRNVEVLPSEMLSVEEKIDKAEVLLMLAKTKTELGDLKGANQTLAELVQLRPNVENYTTTYLHFQAKYFESEYASVNLTEDHEPLPTNLFTTDPPTLYKHICNGLFTQSPSEERDLRCGYLTETHPFLLLAPIKAEELNHYPLLVLYYDVLSDAEIEIMRSLTKNRIVRSKIFGANESVVSRVRTSQAIFLPKTVHKILQTIDVRVEDMTNLNMNFAEDHQFQNYGIGGHYEQHYDWFDLSLVRRIYFDKEMGNRIATVLFYLTDVEQGGGTAFPYLKRLLKPKKGAAAFWYNLHASGEKDQRTLHGGCPIIVGSKWVLNRWIREHDQSERRPCELWSNV